MKRRNFIQSLGAAQFMIQPFVSPTIYSQDIQNCSEKNFYFFFLDEKNGQVYVQRNEISSAKDETQELFGYGEIFDKYGNYSFTYTNQDFLYFPNNSNVRNSNVILFIQRTKQSIIFQIVSFDFDKFVPIHLRTLTSCNIGLKFEEAVYFQAFLAPSADLQYVILFRDIYKDDLYILSEDLQENFSLQILKENTITFDVLLQFTSEYLLPQCSSSFIALGHNGIQVFEYNYSEPEKKHIFDLKLALANNEILRNAWGHRFQFQNPWDSTNAVKQNLFGEIKISSSRVSQKALVFLGTNHTLSFLRVSADPQGVQVFQLLGSCVISEKSKIFNTFVSDNFQEEIILVLEDDGLCVIEVREGETDSIQNFEVVKSFVDASHFLMSRDIDFLRTQPSTVPMIGNASKKQNRFHLSYEIRSQFLYGVAQLTKNDSTGCYHLVATESRHFSPALSSVNLTGKTLTAFSDDNRVTSICIILLATLSVLVVYLAHKIRKEIPNIWREKPKEFPGFPHEVLTPESEGNEVVPVCDVFHETQLCLYLYQILKEETGHKIFGYLGPLLRMDLKGFVSSQVQVPVKKAQSISMNFSSFRKARTKAAGSALYFDELNEKCESFLPIIDELGDETMQEEISAFRKSIREKWSHKEQLSCNAIFLQIRDHIGIKSDFMEDAEYLKAQLRLNQVAFQALQFNKTIHATLMSKYQEEEVKKFYKDLYRYIAYNVEQIGCALGGKS